MRGAVGNAQQNQKRTHPQRGFERIHREVIRIAEEDGRGEDGRHGERLRRSPTAKLPGDQAGETDVDTAGREAEDADTRGRKAKERFGDAGLQGNQRRLVDIAPGEMVPADQEVELIAKEAVA
jgi:hypothetical protein